APAFNHTPSGWGAIESYTVLHDRNGPREVIVVGRLEATGERFIANSIAGDAEALEAFSAEDGLNLRICVRWYQGVNRFAMNQEALDRQIPLPPKHVLDSYEHLLVQRR